MVSKKDIILAVLSGALLILGFPPFDIYLIPWIAFVPLFISLIGKSLRSAFFLGALSGCIFFLGTIFWIFNSLYFYGNIPLVLSVITVVLLCLYLGAYTGIFSLLFTYLVGRTRFPSLFICPVLWVTIEFLRTYALTGFPWALLGYSQYKFLALIQIADITGVYGISFLVVAVNSLLFDMFFYWPKRQNEMPLLDRSLLTLGLITLGIIVITTLSYGIWRLSSDEGVQKVKVSLIQGNFEQDKKWDVKFQKEIIETYKSLSTKAGEEAPSIIIWPETAVPFIFNHDKEMTQDLIEFQKTLGIYLIFGSITIKDIKDNKYQLSNSSVLLPPQGETLAIYDKIHLVPYGEYVPLRRFFPFISKLVEGIGDFVPGKQYLIVQTPFAKIGNLICYEIIFPGLVRKFVDGGADLLVTITNDAWFGRWGAPEQHFSMAVLRAVENRVPIVRAANTGVSGVIDARGIIKKKSDIFVRAVLTEDIAVGLFKKSFYSRYGDLFAFFCIISSVLLIANNISSSKGRSVI
ncbi:MAG: apolipoprotein N-acyltransferase [Nitrospirae bacterium]|nr:apolipoprotein N-acyltransferase [Nitrospirota bacterium]